MNASSVKAFLGQKRFLDKSVFTWILILVNVAGFLFGMYYYWPQLSGTPVGYWLFVADCPLFVLFFALILLFDVRDNFWNVFVSVGLLKYGLWTVFVILLSWNAFIAWNPVMYPLLLVAHLGMALEFVFLLPRMRPSFDAIRTIPIFLLLDYFDYYKGLHPSLPTGTPLTTVIAFSVGSTLILPLILAQAILYYQDHRPLWESVSPPLTRKASAQSARKRPK
jgi:uncharacterized membrane protein YpjA